jgi:predicted 3-demethylubiquinone-9 3-methyltransferase (glyoxalase superfamily)
MPTITPFLWFDANAEEAMNFYCEIFPDAKVGDVMRYGEGAPMPAGTVLTARFEIAGQDFMVLNGGPRFTFDEAISFFVSVETQEEIDRYWDALTADGGEPGQCGWLKDRFGLSWQIVPVRLYELISDPDPVRAQAAIGAMMQMQKIVVADLEAAADATQPGGGT